MKATTLIYLEKEGKYLMLHRVKKKNDVNQDKWIGVGGKFLEGESPEDCALREVKEETGFTMEEYSLRGVVTFVAPPWEAEWMFLYTCTGFSGNMIECDEGDLEWIDKKELQKKNLWEGDRIFLQLLEERNDFFSLKLTYDGDRLQEAVLDGRTIIPQPRP